MACGACPLSGKIAGQRRNLAIAISLCVIVLAVITMALLSIYVNGTAWNPPIPFYGTVVTPLVR